MMKRIIACLVILAVAATAVWSQEESAAERPANTVGLQVNMIGAAISYERSFNPNLSVVGDVSMNIFPTTLTAAAKARLYPFGGIFFVEAGLGYGITIGYLGMTLQGVTGFMSAGIVDFFEGDFMLNGVVIPLGLGWKIDLVKGEKFRIPLLINLGVDFFIGPREKLPFDFILDPRIGIGFSF